MTPKSLIAWTLTTALTATAPPALARTQKPPAAAAKPAGVEIVIRDPGRTGLGIRRYHLASAWPLHASDAAPGGEIIILATPAGGGAARRLRGRLSGCSAQAAEKARRLIDCEGYAALQPAEGSLRITLIERSERTCKVIVPVPAVPGIEGTPIGTAGAPGMPRAVPGIEGTDVSTGAPPAPHIEGTDVSTSASPPPGAPGRPATATSGRADEADRRLAAAIAEARKALPELSCADAKTRGGKRLAQTRAQLAALAGAATPAAAVAPLRRFERAVELLEETLSEDSALGAATRRCAAAHDRCTAAGTAAASCAVEEAICLAGVACPGR
jgi:hypothetical protein